ncbi:hypothetical protein RFX75_00110, partial [Acinetobacter baumannii]|nr:hypothetical protein [Acinetobacter baumannii]
MSQGLSLWLFGLLAIALGGAILRQYGPAALALSVLAVFLALLLLSEVVFVQSVVLPNPPVLADLWRNPSTEAY